jgi:hypothetical protein
MKNMGSKPSIISQEEKALSEAIDRVYKKYGTDLSAFFRDVYEELTIKRQESSKAVERRHAH